MAKITRADIKAEAIKIVDSERNNWEDGVCWVTEKVAFKMRDVIRTVRKNYWGIFDEPLDPVTKREKTWTHLTQKTIEDIVTNIDVDGKDLNFRSRNSQGHLYTEITRQAVKQQLDLMFFGEVIDETLRQLCIDGTVVWKTWETNENGKPKLNRKTVDLLHFFIDPTEQNIQTAYRVTERALLYPEQLAKMSGWYDTDEIKGTSGLDRNDFNRMGTNVDVTANLVDVWETWGKIPKWLITGKKTDTIEIEGHIVVSGLEAGDIRVHLIEENTNKDKLGNIIKPYEEVRYRKVTGRWYGLGPAESILALQELINEMNNVRYNRQRVAQLGLFQIRKGSGITPQMISRLPVSGAIPVNEIGRDIAQMPMQDPSATAYTEEQLIKQWAESVTKAYPISTGEPLPASQTATTSAIQNTNSKTAYVLVKETVGMFFQRWMDRHALKTIVKTINIGDILRFTSDDSHFKELVEKVAIVRAKESLLDLYAEGKVPSESEIIRAVTSFGDSLKGEMLVNVVRNVVAESLDTQFFVTSEDLDTTVTVQNIMSMLQTVPPQYQDSMIRQVFDLMGLPFPRPLKEISNNMQQQNQSVQTITPKNLQQITTNALVPQLNG